jgi:hypothetical protein
MFNPNKHEQDRPMTATEYTTMPIEMQESRIVQAIEIAKGVGLPSHSLSEQLQDLEVQRRVLIWLDSFTDPDEKEEAIQRVEREGLPPEVFKDDGNFVAEGPTALQ